MITVEEATRRIAGAFSFAGAERVGIVEAAHRVIAEDAVARFDQPPVAVSAMDGYAVRAADVVRVPATLEIVGEAPAGHPFVGNISSGTAVRIFTGGVVPAGVDTIVIQEDTDLAGNLVTIKEQPNPGKHIRHAGIDFRAGETLVARGRRLTARDLSLLAAADIAEVAVARKPRVAIVATGDELSRPGAPRKPGGIVASSIYGIAAMVEDWGGVAQDIGILADNLAAFARLPQAARDCDLIVTLGGASVGDHDLVQSGLGPHGFTLDFWKVAMRPGKPLIFGRLNKTPLLGLPGNPVSAMVCAILFLKPAIATMLGASSARTFLAARLASPLPANGAREDYIRARIVTRDGEMWAEPFPIQDSSMQKVFAQCDGLIVRPVGAPALSAGESAGVLKLDDS
jgi:molybdopterin molybdotransferase